MSAWMTYGPFDLSNADDAELIFNHWTKTENDYDYLFVGASINGSNYYGFSLSGDWTDNSGNQNGWLEYNFDLTDVYTLGNLTGKAEVWIAFVFISNGSNVYEGTYLDEITLQKNESGSVQPTLTEHFTCRDGEDANNTRTTEFDTTDYLAVEYTLWNTSQCSEDCEANFSYYDENNSYYAGADYTIEHGYSSWYYWVGIYVSGHYPAQHPGQWNVRVSMDGSELCRDYFNIVAEEGVPDINITPISLDIYQSGGGYQNLGTSEQSSEENNNNSHRRGLIVPDDVRKYWRSHTPELRYDITKLQAAIDWSNNDSPVKSQGNCGSCWAFAAVALVENLGNKSDLSEQVLVSCASGDCSGGWYWDALEYIHSEGVPPENCYPYIQQNGNCSNKCTNSDYLVKLTQYTPAWGLWGEPASVSDMKAQLQNGPICIAMLVPEDNTFDNYSSGIYNYNGGDIPWEGNGHAVLLVGYDDNGQYFKAKNSWGPNWGENGYFRISYDDVTDDVQFGMYGCDASGVYTEGEGNSFTIQNVANGILEINNISSSKSWLSFSPQTIQNIVPGGQQLITVSVSDWNAVTYPQETGTISITSNDPDEGTVNVNVTAHKVAQETPALVVTPSSLDFTAAYNGSNPSDKTFNITNGGTGSFSWNITDSETPSDWLSESPTSGTATTETDAITVSANITGLNPGTYNGTITVTAPGTQGSPKTVNVTLTITEGGPCNPPYIRAEDVAGITGDNVTVEINIKQNPDAIDAFGFQFTYCSDKLSLIEVHKGDLNNNFSFFEGTENPSGVITIGGFDTTPIPENSNGSIAKVVLYVDQCTEGETCTLGIQNLTDDVMGLTICPGTFTCEQPCQLGDVNMDDAISPGDALCAFQIYLNGGTPPSGECNTECALYAADVNCTPNGITPGDALYIFHAYLNGATLPLDCNPTLAMGTENRTNDLQISLAQITSVSDGEITVAIQVDNPDGLTAFGLDMGFPVDLLSFVKVTGTQLTECWQALDGKESVAGVVSIGGFNHEAIASNTTGILATITFKINEGAAGSADFWLFNLQDNLAGAKISSSRFNFPIISTGVRKLDSQEAPETYALEQNYPNPFNMETEIMYQVPDAAFVKLDIYNSMGQKIQTLVSQKQDAGCYAARWNGRNELGIEMSSGVYIYKLVTPKFVEAKKLILIK